MRMMTKRGLGTLEVTMHPPHPLHLLLTNPMVVVLMRLAAVEMTPTTTGKEMRMTTLMTLVQTPSSLTLNPRTLRTRGLASFTRLRPRMGKPWSRCSGGFVTSLIAMPAPLWSTLVFTARAALLSSSMTTGKIHLPSGRSDIPIEMELSGRWCFHPRNRTT
jgi:hypothetical protein